MSAEWVNELARWFMSAPLPVIFATGVILGIPFWILAIWLFEPPYSSPYAHAQQEYERARDAYQRSIEDPDTRALSAGEEPLPAFSFEKAPGLIVTERDLDAMPWPRERKLAEARRCRDLWDGFRIGMRPVEDDSDRGFHWGIV